MTTSLVIWILREAQPRSQHHKAGEHQEIAHNRLAWSGIICPFPPGALNPHLPLGPHVEPHYLLFLTFMSKNSSVPSLLPPGSDFVEDNLSLFQGAERWFQDALGTLLLSCTFFLFLLYPFHLRASGIRLQRLGTPGRTGRLRPNPAYHPLLQIKFYWHTVTPCIAISVNAAFALQLQSWVAETDRATAQPTRMSASTLWLFTEVVCQSLLLQARVLSAPIPGQFFSLALSLPTGYSYCLNSLSLCLPVGTRAHLPGLISNVVSLEDGTVHPGQGVLTSFLDLIVVSDDVLSVSPAQEWRAEFIYSAHPGSNRRSVMEQMLIKWMNILEKIGQKINYS